MDYKNKYNDALEKLQDALAPKDGCEISGLTRGCIESIFPELKESEDERIRKEIIEYIKTGTYHKDWIAWLEKQDNKPVNIDIESMVSSYKQRLESQGNGSMKNNPLVNMCLTAFKHGVEEVLQELNLKEFEKPQGESESERIRKAVKAIKEEKIDNANKPVLDFKASDYYVSKVDGKIHSIHNFNEQKFKVGDWIVDKSGFVQQVLDFRGCIYTCTYNSFTTDCESNYHLWTIEDAKDGDVLYSLDSKQPFIFKHRKKHEQAEVYCGINIYGKFFVGNTKDCIITTDKYIPATKEQRDKLLNAMADAGWTFDFDKKELNKVEPKLKVKYAGSEYDVLEIKEFPGGIIYYGIEDEPNHIDYILPENCEIISGYGVKEKGNSYPTKSAIFSQQSPVWSEEDKNFMHDTISNLIELKDRYGEGYGNVGKCIDWLESLRPRKQWKPSEEQIKALEHFVRGIGESGYVSPYDANLKLVHSLLNDLKKLK